MSQNIRFPLRWIYQIFREIIEILHSGHNQAQSLVKKLSEVRNDLMQNKNLIFDNRSYRTNFSKKLIYLIKKVYRESLKAAAMQTLEEKFFVVMKFVLKRGANYLCQEDLHLVNFVFKACGGNAFAFFEEFNKLVDSL